MSLWLLGIAGTLRKAAGALFGAVTRYPWQSACIALLLVSLWLYHGKSVALSDLKDCKAGRAADHKAYIDAQKAAEAKAIAAKVATEANYRNLARRIDTDAKQAHDSAMADAERYIVAHRVRYQAAGSSAGRTATTTEDRSPGNGQGAGSTALVDEVTISSDDIRICTTNTLQAEAGRTWALQLEATTH